MDDRPEDPLITEVRRFLDSWAEHDADCPARNLTGPGVLDAANCTCGLTVREQQILTALAARLAQSD